MTPAERLAALASRKGSDDGQAQALTAQVLDRLAYRQRHAGKVCRQCSQAKPLSAFGVDSRSSDGLDSRCKECEASRKRISRKSPS